MTKPQTRTLRDILAGEIRVEMVRQGITQRDLAERMGVVQPWIARRLKPGGQDMTTADLEAFAAGLGVPLRQLLAPAVTP